MDASEKYRRRRDLEELSAYEHLLHKVELGGAAEYDDDGTEVRPVADVDEATVFSSRLAHGEMHSLALDIDMHAAVRQSSSRGHFHLFIDHPMTWDDYTKVLTILGQVGILEPGYVAASLNRKATHLRLPWVHKGDGAPSTDTKDEL